MVSDSFVDDVLSAVIVQVIELNSETEDLVAAEWAGTILACIVTMSCSWLSNACKSNIHFISWLCFGL